MKNIRTEPNCCRWIKTFLCLIAGVFIFNVSAVASDPRGKTSPDDVLAEYRHSIEQGGEHRPDDLRKILYLQFEHEDPEVRRNVAEVLGELKEPDTTEFLWNIFNSEQDPLVKHAVLTGIGELGDKTAAKYLLEAMKDGNILVRREAALNCGDLGNKSILKNLDEAFRFESNKLNRLAIALSMVKLGDEKKIGFIEDIVLHDVDHEARRYGAQLLSEVRADFNIRISNDDIRQEKNPYVKVWAACALAVRGDSAMVDYLRGILSESKMSLLRLHAAHALCDRLDDFEYVYPYLLELLKENDWRIREDAVEDLADLSGFQTIPVLGDVLLNDRNVIVREVAAWALGKIRNREALSYLEKGLYDKSPFVRTGVVAAIYKILIGEEENNRKEK